MWTKTFENGVLKIWSPERPTDEAPSIIQPFNSQAGGADWASEAQAMEWADATIYAIENPPAEMNPIEEAPAEEAPAEEAPAEEAPAE